MAADGTTAKQSGTYLTLRTTAAFPVEPLETFSVRDGRGRVVERWTARRVEEFRDSKRVQFGIDGYRSVDAL